MPLGIPPRLFLLASTHRASADPARDSGFWSCDGFSRRSDPLSSVVSGSRSSLLLTWGVKNMTTAVSPAGSTLVPDRPKSEDPAPLRAVHTPNFPALLRQLGASLAGHHLPGRQARDGPRRGGPPQHPLPRLPGADGHGLIRRPAGRRHQDPGLGICRCPGRDRQARPARPARRLLPAPLQPRHGQHPDP